MATGTTFAGGTSGAGTYAISLPTGTYEMTISAPGFKTVLVKDLEIAVAAAVRQDVELQVGTPGESITVTGTVSGGAALLQTEAGDISHNIRSERVNRLPVLTLEVPSSNFGNIRNPLQAVTLLPGASFRNEEVLRVNGLPSSTHTIRIEGQETTNGFQRQTNQLTQASVDAIEEVSIETSNYAAEFGQAGGGYFNYTMKSGSGQYHGGAYDYFVNEALHAGTPFTDDGAGQHRKNRQRRSDYGLSLGGPVTIPGLYDGRDKTFFFFNFEQFRESQFITTLRHTVPTAAYRNGDFSAALTGRKLTIFLNPNTVDPLGRAVPEYGIYDPLTQSTAPNGAVVRDLFPGNAIPANRMDPVAARIQAYLPEPRGGGAGNLTNNYDVPGYENFRHTTIPSIKLDHALSDSIKLSGYYAQTRTQSPSANGIEAPITTAVPQDTRSQTIRVNYDQTLAPTLLLHVGAGLLTTRYPNEPPEFDQSRIGLVGFYTDAFPAIGGLNQPRGGTSIGIGAPAFGDGVLWEYKPTANASLTWVKSAHTIKLGGELIVQGFPRRGQERANGQFAFTYAETAIPWQDAAGLNGTTGYPYASFLLGRANNLAVAQPSATRLGNHALGLFIQDTWKAARKLTLNIGLRYDYVTYLQEQYGRLQSAAFHTPNPSAGGRDGAVIYEGHLPGRCQCSFGSNYPYALGPRLSFAYQLDTATVLRGGFGAVYGSAPGNAYLSLFSSDFNQFNAPGFGEPAAVLAQGNPYREGNPFGNPVLQWPDFNPGKYPTPTAQGLPPQSPLVAIDRNAGRPPRMLQWSIGVQREIARDLVVEAAYVGNRGVWWTAPALADMYSNSLRPELLASQYGIDISQPLDRFLLTNQLLSPIAAQRGFGNPSYPGFPLSQPVRQTLRPYPQWLSVAPFLGPPLGMTWYDSLQAKVTKRYSGGLDVQAAFTWQKELTNGLNSDTSYLTPDPVLTNDIYNRGQNKQLSSQGRPLELVISFSYTTPALGAEGRTGKALRWAARDWTLGGVLRYQSGELIASPPSNNGLKSLLARTDGLSSTFGFATFFNRVPGEPLFLPGFDPNAKFDPTQQAALNPAAWTDAGPGEFGTAAAYYDNYRWQRQPSEALSLGRVFRMGREGRFRLQVRAEFQNVFNRLFYSSPAVGGPLNINPLTPVFRNLTGSRELTGGYGYVNYVNGAGSRPRRGQMVARFSF